MLNKENYILPPIYDQSFPIYIEKQSYYHAGSLFPIHWHEQLELIYILEGDFFINSKNNQWEAQAGDLICINPHEIHHVQSHSLFTQYYCIVIDSEFLVSGILDYCEQKYYSPLWASTIGFNTKINSPQVKDIILGLIHEFELKKDGYELAIKGYSHLLIANLYRDELIKSNDTLLTTAIQPTHVREILTLIHNYYTTDLSLAFLSNQLHLDTTYLSHIFKDVTGTSIGSYIKKYRLRKAQFLLETTSNSIESIAYSCGFNSTNYFSRAFKQHYQMSPNHYRKSSHTTQNNF